MLGATASAPSCISPPSPMSASRSTEPAKYFQQQRRRHARPARGDARDRGEADRLLLDLRDLRHARADADPRRHAAAPGQSLWRDQADDRARAPLVRRGAWPALGRAALFQRRRRRSRWRDRRGPRPRDASDPARSCDAALGRRAAYRRLRHRLPDAGRHARSATISMCRISPTRMSARWTISATAARAAPSISAPATAIRCAR